MLPTDALSKSGVLDLMQLASHPGDRVSYRHFKMTPLANAMYPNGVPPIIDLSVTMADEIAAKGADRTMERLCSVCGMRAKLAAAKPRMTVAY